MKMSEILERWSLPGGMMLTFAVLYPLVMIEWVTPLDFAIMWGCSVIILILIVNYGVLK